MRTLRIMSAQAAPAEVNGMKPIDKFRQGMKLLSDAIRSEANADGRTRSNINVASRRNVVVSTSVGESDSVHSASSTQHVRIRQDGMETETEEDAAR
jgi:hypothetical protein